jgi:hypothetical protein
LDDIPALDLPRLKEFSVHTRASEARIYRDGPIPFSITGRARIPSLLKLTASEKPVTELTEDTLLHLRTHENIYGLEFRWRVHENKAKISTLALQLTGPIRHSTSTPYDGELDWGPFSYVIGHSKLQCVQMRHGSRDDMYWVGDARYGKIWFIAKDAEATVGLTAKGNPQLDCHGKPLVAWLQ